MYIAMNRFYIKRDFVEAFEKQWRERESQLSSFSGYVRFRLLRGDYKQEDPGVYFISYTEWIDQDSFLNWLNGGGAQRAHSKKQSSVPQEAYIGPPQFTGFHVALEEGRGHRTDFRSPHMDGIVESHFAKESPQQKEIFSTSINNGLPPINVGALEGKTLEIFLRMIQAKKGVEVGTLGGYSSSWLARAMPIGGEIHTLELDPKRSALAAENLRYLENSGVKIHFHVGDAKTKLAELVNQGPFDFVFIDADKSGYPTYAQWAVSNVRKGGLILCDNAYIWGGMNHYGKDPESLKYPKSQESIYSYSINEFRGMSQCWNILRDHPDLETLIFPTGEGLAVSIKK
jgi:predicted O-methyltransferase YrrM/heme-degrading monooxygenase HmoA